MSVDTMKGEGNDVHFVEPSRLVREEIAVPDHQLESHRSVDKLTAAIG
jgi:hypothetical protein